MMIIDFHHHLLDEPNYADRLVQEMKTLGISKICISGLGIGKGRVDSTDYSGFNLGGLSPDNTDVLSVVKKYSDQLIGLGVINLGKDTPDIVAKLKAEGFRGLKTTRPKKSYDADEYMEFYSEAERLRMPFLFHTGMILPTVFDKDDDVSSERMSPMKVDRIARNFPHLKIVLAHLGYPWYDEATTMVRYHKNVFVDLSGGELGWRNRLSPTDFHKLFFWKGAFEKIVFGTDTDIKGIKGSLTDQMQLFHLLNLDDETIEKIMYKNASFLLGNS